MSDQLKPPWLEFPEYPAGHIGWRMGGGEGYLCEIHDWLIGLDEEVRQKYLLSLTIPPLWVEWACTYWVYPDSSEEALDEAWDILDPESSEGSTPTPRV